MLWVWKVLWERNLIYQTRNEVPFSSQQRVVLVRDFFLLLLRHFVLCFLKITVSFIVIQSTSLIFGEHTMVLHWFSKAVAENDLTLYLSRRHLKQTLKSLSSGSVKKSPEWGHHVTKIVPMLQSLYKACVNEETHMNGACGANYLPKVLQPLLRAPLK